MNDLKRKNMENKQYPPRGGPPLVCRCRGIPYAFNADRSGDAIPELAGTGRFQVEAARADLSVPIAIGTTPDNVGRDSCCQNFRIEEDAGPPGRFQVPNLQGFGNLEGLKSSCKVREPAGHPPEAVCRSGTPAEACCVRFKMMVRVRDGTVVHIRDDTDLHIRNGKGLGIRNASVNRPVHPPEWESYGGKETRIDDRISNPAGLHVYRKRKDVLNATPRGVEQLSALHYFYKHLIPLESGRPKPENQSLEPATWNLQPVTLKEAV